LSSSATYLKWQGLSQDYIPDNGEEVLLRFNSNLSTGGTTEECFDEIDPYYLNLAIKAVKAIGLKVGGVDLIAEDISKEGPCIINEILTGYYLRKAPFINNRKHQKVVIESEYQN